MRLGEVPRETWRRARLAIELRQRRLPDLDFDAQVRATRVLYVCPDSDRPSGGVRVIYRHVDELKALGFDAAVVHRDPDFRVTWFPNTTPVLGKEGRTLGPGDLVVVPDYYGPVLHQLPSGCRSLMFNQGVYHTYDFMDLDGAAPGFPYSAVDGVLGIVTVSRDSVRALEFAFPDLPVHFTRSVLDPETFHPPAELAERPRAVAFTRSRRPGEEAELVHLLRGRGALPGWEFMPIRGAGPAEVAATMRRSPVFMSLSDREGFGLPPAEAMACGCYVVGYAGLGGRDYFDPSYTERVDDGDTFGLAIAVEKACLAYERDPLSLLRRGQQAAEHVLGEYTAAGLREDLLSLYEAHVER